MQGAISKKTVASAIERQFWLLHQLNPESPAYNMHSVFRLGGNLDSARLEACVNIIWKHSAILRTTYIYENDELYQVHHPYTPIHLTLENRGLNGDAQTASVKVLTDEVSAPFDLERGPLVRFKLLLLGNKECFLAITMHHIVADLRSEEIFGEWLSVLYNADNHGGVEDFDTVSYADYSQWLSDWMTTDKYRAGLSYWKKRLQDTVGILALHTDYPRPPHRSLTGSAVAVAVSPALTAAIREFCMQDPYNNVLLTIMSVYAGLLYRYSGQEKICIGVPFTNRRKAGVKNTLGCFVNTLPIVVEIDETTSLLGLIDSIRLAMLDAHRYQEVPLAEIDRVAATRHNPLFQSGFTFTHQMELSLHGVETEPVYVHNGGSQMDLFASFRESAETLWGQFEYDTELFDESTVQRMANNFIVLLKAAIDNPAGHISTLPVLSKEEFALVTTMGRHSARCFQKCSRVSRLFEQQAATTPNAPAVVFEDVNLTYAELDARAERLAGYLQSAGVTCNTMVLVVLEPSIESVVALWGVLKAGGVYVPVDADESVSRMESIVCTVSPQLILTQHRLVNRLPRAEAEILCLDADWEGDAGGFDRVHPTVAAGDSLACVSHTAGSTGVPRAVLHTHENICNVLQWMQETFPCLPDERILQMNPYALSVSLIELMWPYTVGACVVIAPQQSRGSMASLANIITDKKITTLFFIPARFCRFVALVDCGSYATVQRVLCTGEPLPKGAQERFFAGSSAQLYNLYGCAETTAIAGYRECKRNGGAGYVGGSSTVANTDLYVLDTGLQPVPVGVAGELYVGGASVSRGYLNAADLTDTPFIEGALLPTPVPVRLFKTGDMVRWSGEGFPEYICRVVNRATIGGVPVEPSVIEAVIEKEANVKQCMVTVREDVVNEKKLVAYFIAADKQVSEQKIHSDIRRHISVYLPACLHPSSLVQIDELPHTTSGKVNLALLPQPASLQHEEPLDQKAVYRDEERKIAGIWVKLLNIDNIPVDISFFNASGTSILAARLAVELQQAYGRRVPVAMIFQYPTIRDQAEVLGRKNGGQEGTIKSAYKKHSGESAETDDVAVVGMSCRFPGVATIKEYWKMLTEGEENISFFDDDKIPEDIDANLRENELYVRAKGILDDVDLFDADFFGFNPLTAEATDPQMRLFLEHSYDALENAGYAPGRGDNSVGVYAGMGRSLYLRYNILPNPDVVERVGELQIELGHEKDHLPTRVSHSLNLTGPSVSVSTACSTSLVAIIMACQAIRRGDCTIALAGGSNIAFPLYRGHLHQEGAFLSRDGHCRPFDADSSGTTFSDGVGVVALKKLSVALAQNNTIYAVIKAGAINNDGAKKVSYTAPGVDGQVAAITAALHEAGVAADTVGYIETHGTGTPLGDPIEIEALTQAYRRQTGKKQYCAIGSVKSNIGHTAISAGAAGFIKTVLMLYHKMLVPSLYYTKPNPAIDFDNSPFFVNTEHTPWKSSGTPRRAGVSSFGFGGTNAHVILEEAPVVEKSGPSREWQMLPFSAKSPGALAAMVRNFGEHIGNSSREELADSAYTLQVARHNYPYRRAVVCDTGRAFTAMALQENTARPGKPVSANRRPTLVFMYPGQGNQYVKMGRALYVNESVYREAFDACADALHIAPYERLQDVLFGEETSQAQERLKNTYYAQTSIFATEYALSRLWLYWGIKPDILVGHSVGEFCAACIAGIMSLEDAAKLVATRGNLMSACEPGGMLSVRLPEKEVLPLLTEDLSVAAVNSPQLCVVSGPYAAIEKMAEKCASREVLCRPLHTSHAFHSAMMEPAVEGFERTVRSIRLSPPAIPVISTVTGELLSAQTATDPDYWSRHMRVTVRFSDAVSVLLSKNSEVVLLEVGPRATCCTLARQQVHDASRCHTIASTGVGDDWKTEDREVLTSLAKLWELGYEPDWDAFYRSEKRGIVALPPYPFERKRHWIDAVVQKRNSPSGGMAAEVPTVSDNPESVEEYQTVPAAPENDPVLSTVKKMVAEAVGVSPESIDTNATFLQLGMDSLYLTQMSHRVKSQFGVTVSMRQLMRLHSTIAKLVEHITTEKKADSIQL